MYLERFSDVPVAAIPAHVWQQAGTHPRAPEVGAPERRPVAALVDASLEGQNAAWRAGRVARHGRVPLQLLWTGRTRQTGQQSPSLRSLCWHLQEELHVPVVASRDLHWLFRGDPAEVADAPSLRVAPASAVTGSMLSGLRLRGFTKASSPVLLVRRVSAHRYRRVVACLDALDDPVTILDLALRTGADPDAARNARIVRGCDADALLAAEEEIFADLLLVSRHLGRAAPPWSGRNALTLVLARTQADVLLL